MLAAVALYLYVSSLWLPAFDCPPNLKSDTGFEVLISGWIALIFLDVRWLANIAFPWLLVIPFFLKAGSRGSYGWLVMPLLTCLLAANSWSGGSMAGCGMSAGTSIGSDGLGEGGIFWVQALVLASVAFTFRLVTSYIPPPRTQRKW